MKRMIRWMIQQAACCTWDDGNGNSCSRTPMFSLVLTTEDNKLIDSLDGLCTEHTLAYLKTTAAIYCQVCGERVEVTHEADLAKDAIITIPKEANCSRCGNPQKPTRYPPK
jgi:hypothetical protein